MIAPTGTDTSELPLLERELSQSGLRSKFSSRLLEGRYNTEQRDQSRLHNRITISLVVAVFDAFYITELHALPEALWWSALLRFGLLTPLTLMYVMLDWRGVAKRWTGTIVTALLIAPTLMATIESFYVTSPSALINYQTVPLAMFAPLVSRISLRQTAICNLSCCLLYVASILHASFVPAIARPSMVAMDLAFGIGTLALAWRLDTGNRRVFLYTQQARLGRELLVAQNVKLARLSQMDALTGLGNRRCFEDRLATIWQAGIARNVATTLLMFDIDCFKQFNDLLGHQAGDECLVAVARAVSRCLRDERDTLVRYGGEEFAIILPDTTLAEGEAIAERVRSAVVERGVAHPGGGPMHVVTVSLGLATVDVPHQTAASLIEAADRCLYAAKRSGRNCVRSVHSRAADVAFQPARRGMRAT